MHIAVRMVGFFAAIAFAFGVLFGDACRGHQLKFEPVNASRHCLVLGQNGIERLHDDASVCVSNCERTLYEALDVVASFERRALHEKTQGVKIRKK